MVQASTHHDRRPVRRRQRSASSVLPWIIAVVVLAGVGGALLMNRSGPKSSAADLGIIRDRTETIIAAWRDLKTPPSFDKSNTHLFSPTSWNITAVEVDGTRGRVVASVESANKGGDPVRVTWEFRFARYAGDGWTCTKLVNAQDGYDAAGWKK